MTEVWKPVVGYEGFYEVSSLGQVKSVRYNRMLKGFPNIDGYPQVGLCINYKKRHFRIHRLVLEAFEGLCPYGHEARHFPDQTKTNCRLDNLQWAPTAVNMQDNVDKGCYNNGQLSDEQVREIRTIDLPYGKTNEYCRKLGISRTTFHVVRRGEAYKHVKEL